MKPYNSSRMLVCDYDHESGKFSISLNGGRFETPSEEVFVNQLHKMLGAPHQSVDVALLNKHVTVQRTFVNQHLYLSMAYVVRPLDILLVSQSHPQGCFLFSYHSPPWIFENTVTIRNIGTI